MSKFEQFFSSHKLMMTAFFITLIAFAAMIVMDSISIASYLQNIFSVAFGVIMFFIALSMYRSFAKHETNAMNIVTGAAIGIMLIYDIQIAVSSLEIDMSISPNGVVTGIIESVLLAILLINHVQINSIHRSVRGRIILNQVLLLFISAFQIFLIIAAVIFWTIFPDMAVFFGSVIALALAKTFTFFMIICIETKLNAYKTDRDTARAEGTWTDEKKAETKEKYFGK